MTCPAIDGIIAEADDIAGDTDNPEVWMRRSPPLPRPWNTMRLLGTAR